MIRKLEGLFRKLAPDSSLEMSIRLFQLICLVITALTIFVILPVNLLQNLPILVNIGDVLLGLFAFFCYWESIRGRHHQFLFLIVMVLLMEPIWFLNSGTNGSITFYLMVVVVYPMVMFRGLKRWTLTACMTLNICTLLAIDYFVPSLSVPFRSQSDRVLDLITGVFCSCLGLVMIVWVVLSNYDRERERTEKYARDLANQHDRLAVTVAAIPDLLFELDADGRICQYHASSAESLYARPETFLGKTIDEVLPPDAADVILKALQRAACEGSHRGAIYALDMPGGRRWYELSIAVKPEGSAPDARFVALVRDITERRQAEAETLLLREELALFSRAATVSEMTASIAHELNQPLAAILANAESAVQMMQGGTPDLKEIREILEDIVADDGRAAEIIRSVRSMLKRGDGERCPVLLNDLITEVLSLVRNDALRREIAIILELGSVIPPVEGNRVQLQQVILNLVRNAFEAMEASESRELVLRTCHVDGKVTLDVMDSGSGISPDKLGSIFEPFFTTKTTGLGLGLSVSRSIVVAHNGRLWADNNMQGGSTFHLTLPTVDAPMRRNAGIHQERIPIIRASCINKKNQGSAGI